MDSSSETIIFYMVVFTENNEHLKKTGCIRGLKIIIGLRIYVKAYTIQPGVTEDQTTNIFKYQVAILS